MVAKDDLTGGAGNNSVFNGGSDGEDLPASVNWNPPWLADLLFSELEEVDEIDPNSDLWLPFDDSDDN